MDPAQLLEYIPDPAIAVDGADRLRAFNGAARELFDTDGDATGQAVSTLFTSSPDLAERYAETLGHYTDVGGIVEDGVRHFDVDHPTVAALLEGTDPEASDPDVGVLVDGRLQYFHVTESALADPFDGSARLVVFREITDLKRRERDLDFLMQVVTRVLRHNLRNDLTVVRGYAETIEDRASDPVTGLAAEIDRKCQELVETSEKARLIQDVIDADSRVEFDLATVVADCLATLDHDDAELTVDVPSVDVAANPHLPRAIEDMIENGIVYSDDPARVEITATREDPWVVFSVADDGPGIPDDELETLTRRSESDLVHGSGAGLWLTYTVVEESGGEITYDTGEDGTTVRMRLPVAD